MTTTELTKTELNAFRRVLENRRNELGNGNSSREALVIETSADELDRIQFASDRDRAMGDLERSSNRLREVLAAQRRIHAGTFGICVGCGENIKSRRLAAAPWASSCIGCQEAAEREQNALSEGHASLVMAA
jgi:DnaK suppressor protein